MQINGHQAAQLLKIETSYLWQIMAIRNNKINKISEALNRCDKRTEFEKERRKGYKFDLDQLMKYIEGEGKGSFRVDEKFLIELRGGNDK